MLNEVNMKVSHLLITSLLAVLLPEMALGAQLTNYMGTGSNPRLHLELSEKNGPGWKSFTIDYQGIGTIPSSSNPAIDYSPWNIKDEDGNYYGTITLHSNGVVATWSDYSRGANNFYLEGVHFSYNEKIKSYQLTVDTIHAGDSSGPFPEALSAVPAVHPNTGKKIVFTTKDANIVDEQGHQIILKGVVRPSLEWNKQGQNLSVADIQKMHQWGANTIRLDLNQNYWFQSGPVTQKGSYKQIINAIVYYAIQNHMAIILDLHWTENGHQSSMANQESLRFWKEVAADYKEFGTVIFELFNEPVSIDKTVWLNGDKKYAGYQQLYNTVRATGAENIVIINGLDYGYDLSFVNDSFQINGYNIVYGSHPYNEKGNINYNGMGGSFENNFQGIKGKYPLIFTEFGVNEARYFPSGYQAVYQRILEYSNAAQVSYTAFAWWVDESNPNLFPDVIKDWNGTPMNGGVAIHDDLQAKPGSEL